MTISYKGYRFGTIEKCLLKTILNISEKELPTTYHESFSDIFRTHRKKSEYSRSIQKLKAKGIVSFVNKNGDLKVVLTKKGETVASNLFLDSKFEIKKPKVWDKKWRMVIFDIPEKDKKKRNLLRFHLKKIGFVQVQGSAWLYPFACDDIVTIIKTNFDLNKEVLYLKLEYLENDHDFRKIFKI